MARFSWHTGDRINRVPQYLIYSRSSRKRPPKIENLVVTRAGRLQEYALERDPMVNNRGWSLTRASDTHL